MKKLLMGTAFLVILGLVITSSQFSCIKSSAQTTNPTVVGKVLLEKSTIISSDKMYTTDEKLSTPIKVPTTGVRGRFSADYNSLFVGESNGSGGTHIVKFNFVNNTWVKDSTITPLNGFETGY